MKRRDSPFAFRAALWCGLVGLLLFAERADAQSLAWSKLPPIPDAEGFAGPFAGVHNEALVVAGGTNFPDLRPWEGGTKVWYDTAFVLDKPDGKWRRAGKLPRPVAYGVSLTTPKGIACIGGADAEKHYADCFWLRFENGHIVSSPLPSLPKPCAYFCGGLVDRTIYVAGGIEKPDDTKAMHAFWSLDLDKPESGWNELTTWPGRERMLATAGAQEGSFFLFGGTALMADERGKPAREMLRDAFRYTPTRGWQRIADLPRASVAAPTPAPAIGQSKLFLLGGDDGAQLDTPQAEHRGFPRGIQACDTLTGAWTKRGDLPFSLVTTTTVRWNDRVIVPGGEARPGVRSTEVWSGAVEP